MDNFELGKIYRAQKIEALEIIKSIDHKIELLESEGFEYLQEWQEGFHVPDRVNLPDGRIYDEKELINERNRFPRDQTLLRAQMMTNLFFFEGYEEQRFAHYSFLNDHDESQARAKYSQTA